MILHCDADAFFASVEQAADRSLRGRAIAVGGEKRGIIASASYEARKLGIYTPMPTVKARKLCPSLIVIPGDYAKYERFSRLMFSLAYDFTPMVEVASIDECYMDITGSRVLRAGDAGAKLQRAISDSLKLSVSVGVGANKLVSQIASKLRKPHCFIEVEPGYEQGFLWPLQSKWLPSVGPVLEATLNTAGLCKVGHVAATPVEALSLLVGKGAPQLRRYAMGEDNRPVVCERPEAKGYGEQETFNEDTTDTAFIVARLRAMADGLMRRVRSDHKSIRTVTLRLRYNDMDEVTRATSLDEPTDLENDIYPMLAGMLKRAWERRVSVRLVGLRFTNVYEAAGFMPGLALEQSDAMREKLHTMALVVDDLRRERLSIMRGHDLWLKQQKNAPRQTLPPTRVARVDSGLARSRVLLERPASGPQILVPSSVTTPAPMLNVKSCYSFLDSALTVQAIVEAAVAYGLPAVAITDPSLHAAVPFYQAAVTAGIKPIIGAELRCDGRPLLAYVKNEQGYRNLCGLLSVEGGIPAKLLAEQSSGLIVLDVSYGQVALPEIRYRSHADAVFYNVLQSMRTLTLLHESHPEKRRGDFAFHPPQDFANRYDSAALQAARDMAEQCEFAFDFQTLRFPRYIPADGSTPAAMLARLAYEGLHSRYGGKAHLHEAQVAEELAIIGEVGYEEYFLTVWQLLQECAALGISWLTRGSAADSLVCYCLGISNVCPVRFELYFQRFLNRDRMALQKLPDIDIDFAHDKKDEVVELLLKRFGPEHAAIVGGFSTFQARSAFAEIGKVLGLSEREIRRLTGQMPSASARQIVAALPGTLGGIDAVWQEEPQRTALLMAERLDGFPRYAKMHPCGVVLSREPIRHHTPTFTSAKGWPTTHFDMDAVEAVGLIKLDILAQGGLAVLRDCSVSIKAEGLELDLLALETGGRGGTERPPRQRPVEPWSDEAVWQMIASGNARGVHHIESPAMTSLACMAGLRDIDGLVALVSVIRPGAANGLKKTEWARRAQGLAPVDYTHESLAGVLRSTFGVIAYEEHILQVCEAFAGMRPGRADVLRRALVKNDNRKIAEMQLEFTGLASAAGRDPESIVRVWALVAGFRGYAFCRAHSTAYGVEAYQGAYAKHYHPAEFMAAVLTNGKGFYGALFYTLECRRLGIGFLLPDVNCGSEGYLVQASDAPPGTPALPIGKAIRVPVTAVKDLSVAMLERWRKECRRGRFETVRDFVERVRPSGAESLNLIRVGAFDSIGGTRTEHFWKCLHSSHEANTGTDWLFKGAKEEEIRAQYREEPGALQKLRDEMDLLGYSVSGHPLDYYPDVAWQTYCPINELHCHAGKRVTVCGLIVVSRSHFQANGLPMKFISIVDYTGIVECEIFAAAYRAYGLATIRFPVVQVRAEVVPFDNGAGFTLKVERVAQPRKNQ